MRKVVLGVFFLATFAFSTANAATADSGGLNAGGSEVLFGGATFGNTMANLNLQGAPVATFTMALGYQRLVMPALQLGLRGNFAVSTVASPWNALVWGTWNFDDNLADAVFLGVGAGINNTAGTMGFAAGAEIGKRFEIAKGLMWRPTVEVSHIFSTGANWVFDLNIINFSYLW